MAIAFTVQQNKFTDKKGRKLFYARLVKTGTKDSKYIAQRIARETALQPSDVLHVINALPDVMREELMNGNNINLDGIGIFAPTITKNKGFESEEEVTPAGCGITIRFRPTQDRTEGRRLASRSLADNEVQFIRVYQKDKPASANQSGTPGGGGTPGGNDL